MLLQICDSLQPAKLQPFRFLLLSVWRELHESGEPHYHVAINGCRGFRFNPFKKALLVQYGLASHWSASHQHYASAFSYCYMPSDTGRSIAELDPTPLLWPGCSAGDVAHGVKPHPPPAEARRAPATASATAACREKAARRRAGEGKPEQRLKDFDLWPVVVNEGIKPARGVVGKVVAYAKRGGGQSMTQWCFDSEAKIPEFVARCWRFGGGRGARVASREDTDADPRGG